MIKRHYFMSAKINHLDGNQSYTWHYIELNTVGWFQNPIKAFNDALDVVKKVADSRGFHHENIEVVCFSRC